MGRVADRLRDVLQQGFQPQRLDIVDDSARHAGHAGAGPDGERPAKAGETMVTVKWLSPPGLAPAWPAWRELSSTISSRSGSKRCCKASRSRSATRPIIVACQSLNDTLRSTYFGS